MKSTSWPHGSNDLLIIAGDGSLHSGLPPHDSGVLLFIDGGGFFNAGGAVLGVEKPLCFTSLTSFWLLSAGHGGGGLLIVGGDGLTFDGYCLSDGGGGYCLTDPVDAFTQTFVGGSTGSLGTGGGGL